MAQVIFSLAWLLNARQDLDQRRLPRTIYSYQSNAISAFNDEIGALEDQLLAITFGNILEFRNCAPAGLWLGKMKMDGLLFRGNLDTLHALEFFDAALYLLRFGSLIPKTINKCFELLDLFALIAVSRFKLRPPFSLLLKKL